MEREEPDRNTVTVNGRVYPITQRPTVIIVINGCATDYLAAAIDAHIMPNLEEVLRADGFM
jgi:hypothetical protein